jgi:hypothetical protein
MFNGLVIGKEYFHRIQTGAFYGFEIVREWNFFEKVHSICREFHTITP